MPVLPLPGKETLLTNAWFGSMIPLKESHNVRAPNWVDLGEGVRRVAMTSGVQ